MWGKLINAPKRTEIFESRIKCSNDVKSGIICTKQKKFTPRSKRITLNNLYENMFIVSSLPNRYLPSFRTELVLTARRNKIGRMSARHER